MAGTTQIIFYLNDMLIELIGLEDALNPGTYINAGATVEVTLQDSLGVDVLGETWPLAMSYVAASDGEYRATLQSTLTLVVHDLYFAEVTVAATEGEGRWELPLRVEVRKFE